MRLSVRTLVSVVSVVLTLSLCAQVKWTYSGTTLTEILPDGSSDTAWAFTLSAAGALSAKTAGTGTLLDLRNETLPDNAPKIVGTFPRLITSGSATCTEVRLPEGITALTAYAFSGWSVLETISIPSGVTVVPERCFWNCYKLTSLTLPEGLTTLGACALYNCTALPSLHVPSTLKTIGQEALRACSNLTTIEPFLPDSITSFGYGCLRDCPKLTGELRLGYGTNDGVMVATTLVGNGYYFSGDTALKTLRIGPGVSTLPENTFIQSSFAFVELGPNIARTGSAFARSSGLTNLVVHYTGDFKLDGQTFNDLKLLREITWDGWFSYAVNTYVFNNWPNLQCRFIVPRTNDTWNTFMADTAKMTPWADCSASDKTAYFARYGEDAVWPAGISVAVANGLPCTYIVKTLEGAEEAQLVAHPSNRDMASVTISPAPSATTGLYATNTLVTVSVSVKPGATFVGWEGDIADGDRMNATISVRMNESRNLLAKIKVQHEIVTDSATVVFPRNDSQAQVRFALTGPVGAVYSATAEVLWRVDGSTWMPGPTLAGLTNGQQVAMWIPQALDPGSTLDVKLSVSSPYADVRTAEMSSLAVPQAWPASYGKGGGATVCHVWFEATGDGSGTDWYNARTSFPNQADLKSGQTAIWVAGNAPVGQGLGSVRFTGPLDIFGGFVGTECAVAVRATNVFTRVDGAYRASSCLYLRYSGRIHIDGFEFTRAKTRGLQGPESSDYQRDTRLELSNCRFTANGLGWDSSYQAGGRALYLSGVNQDWNNTLWVSNCYFGGNACTNTASDWTGKAAVWASSTTAVEFRDCTFETNGIAWWQPIGSDSRPRTAAGGSALRVDCGNVALTRCVFRGNRNASGSDNANYPDSCVQISNTQSSKPWRVGITNCLFIGNETTAGNKNESGFSGALALYDTARATTADVVNCTFAYNIDNTSTGSAGLSVRDGNVRVRNSIFYGNRLRPGNLKGCDLRLSATTATADIDYTLFGALGVSNICNKAGESFTLGDHVYAGDPKFVSSDADFLKLVVVTNAAANYATFAQKPDAVTLAGVMALDAHVDANDSPAIDAGDDSPYENEPNPNGGIINLGCYGNTSEAHVTVVAQPEIVDGAVTVTFPYETSQPHVRFALGGEAGVSYRANAVLEWTTNGTDWVEYETLYGLGNGDVYDRDWLLCFVQGSILKVRVTVTAPGAEVRGTEQAEAVDYPMSASYGKGGGQTVCHVRSGATGDGSGSDWFNARTSFPKTRDEILSAMTEVWVADDVPPGVGLGSANLAGPRTIRGGFVGTENTIAERTPGAYTRIDGTNVLAVGLSLTFSTRITVEGFHFTRCSTRGFGAAYSGASHLDVRNCRFTANGLGRDDYWLGGGGRGLHFSGGAGSYNNSACVSNCYFGGNACACAKSYNVSGIGALNLTDLKRADVYDCTFETNGVAWTYPVGTASVPNAAGGGALRIVNSPCSVVRCVFRGNRVPSSGDSNVDYCSSIVEISSGSTYFPYNNGITNCLFIGNESVCSHQNRVVQKSTGALYINDKQNYGRTDIVNCTFAYNTFATSAGSAGLSVVCGNDVHVKNSIFYGNRILEGNYKGADLKLCGSSGSVSVDYSIFGSLEPSCVATNAGCTLTLGAGIRVGNPKLVSSVSDFARCLTRFEIGNTVSYAYDTNDTVRARVMALNGHLRGHCGYTDETTGQIVHCGGRSPALDAGDPLDAYDREPAPRRDCTNGKRINAGAYGNTPWATMSLVPGSFLRVR